MKIFKFGGASVKDAESVKRVAKVLAHYPNEEILIVVSAMGKTTNALEQVVHNLINKNAAEVKQIINALREQHFKVAKTLFADPSHRVFNDLEILFTQLEINTQAPINGNYNELYDLIVSFGELLSTQIVSNYLNQTDFKNTWLDARRLIETNADFRFARVDWSATTQKVKAAITQSSRYVTQGFIAATKNLTPTTLGREGSDYTASVLAYILEAQEVVIWKDVEGVLNGDPKIFDNTQLLHEISYREAIELAYYGASVIHPKTIQPLQEKGIPLRVKSFLNPAAVGTLIKEGSGLKPMVPCFIKKDQQCLITISTRDLAFIVEDHLSKVYQIFHDYGARINLSQNTAVSTSFCLNNDKIVVPKLLKALEQDFEVKFTPNLRLYTVRHCTPEAQARVQKQGKIWVEQASFDTYQVVVIPI